MARWAETCGKDMYPGNIHLGHDSTVMDIETCHESTFVLVKMHALVVGFEIMIVLRVKELWDRLLVFVLPLCQHTHLPSHNQTSIHSRWNRILGSFVISLADASSYFPSKSTSNHTCHEGWDFSQMSLSELWYLNGTGGGGPFGNIYIKHRLCQLRDDSIASRSCIPNNSLSTSFGDYSILNTLPGTSSNIRWRAPGIRTHMTAPAS